jgi:hypothetical protein
MLHVVLDRQKISETILEKAFFFILWRFYLFPVFVSQNLKKALLRGETFFHDIGRIACQKIENVMLIYKMPTCLSAKSYFLLFKF